MSLITSLSYWLLLVELWLILGLLFVMLEVTLDGSMVIFLPLGIGGFMNAAALKIQQNIPMDSFSFLPETWEQTLISFAIFTALASIILRLVVRHKKTDTTPDVNDY
ncbi:MAG: hypothetical protein ACPHOL_02805 [Candidatus Puniceispirillum sp.]